MTHGHRVTHTRLLEQTRKSMNYHMADSNGQAYLCDCMRGIRINGKIKLCGGRWIKTNRRNK